MRRPLVATRRTLTSSPWAILVIGALAAVLTACTTDSSTPDWEYQTFPGDDDDATADEDTLAGGGGPDSDDDAATADDTAVPDAVGPNDTGPPAIPDAEGGGEALPCVDHSSCQQILGAVTSVCETAACIDGACLVLPAPDGAPCDDGDACTTGDACAAGGCAGEPRDCDDGDVCTSDGCNPLDGECFTTPLDSSSFPCDDGDACTTGDACLDGACTGAAVDCDDDNPCTADSCDDPAVGCVNDAGAQEGATCDDGSACTSGDTCVAGACVGESSNCSDGDPCTADACDPASGACAFHPSIALDGLACDDGDLCTISDACWAGACTGGPSPCDDGSCQTFACDDATGACEVTGTLEDGAGCSDGDPCTADDTCSAGGCVGAATACDDNDPCTVDTCDPVTGACDADPAGADGLPCDDGDPCTGEDFCDEGFCSGPQLVCDDDNPCTEDTCDEGGCSHEAGALDGAACDTDGDLCTGPGTCSQGACDEAPVTCDDGDPCTDDACAPDTGDCTFTPASGADCDDGDACTSGDVCADGTCAGPSSTDCDDGDACTIDSCAPETGCAHVLDDEDPTCLKLGPCNATTVAGSKDSAATDCVCALDPFCCDNAWDGLCVQAAQDACGVSCGCDGSEAAATCSSDADCGFCDADGDLCNGSALCVEGRCAPKDPVVCPAADLGPCAANTCVQATGECQIAAVAGACDDGLACTEDACDLDTGTCSWTQSPLCTEQSCCQASAEPSCHDSAAVECVCALDAGCCFDAWSDACVALAQAECGLSCACPDLPADELTCSADEDCGFCNDGDLCNGAWICGDGGVCVDTGPSDCSAGLEGCQVGSCDPATGACVTSGDDAACDDGDPCTAASCDALTGACIPGESQCGIQHPCASADLPGSNDEDITGCVCALDVFCCEAAWDELCVDTAQSACGLQCGCAVIDQACEDDAGCASCEDGDACNGTWACVESKCIALPAVICEDEGGGCVESQCVPATGLCESVANDAACDDGDPCTFDTCDGETGECFVEEDPACSSHSPCTPDDTPGSSEPAVDECVCATQPSCCAAAWTEACVQLAIESCGAICECGQLDIVPCGEDGDCAFCDSEDLCAGTWECVEGRCEQGDDIGCPEPEPGTCFVQATCDPETGECAFQGDDALCDDAPPCTVGRCDGGGPDGCSYVPQLGCDIPSELCTTHPEAASEDGAHPITAAIIACLCPLDPFCCEVEFDQICVDGVTQACGYACDCEAADGQPCEEDAHCAPCDGDGDLCNGGWACEGGFCVEAGPPECETPADATCATSECEPATGQCVLALDDAPCATGEICTAGFCSPDTGQCATKPVAGCTGGGGDPCGTWPLPGSTDDAVEACVCAADPFCCNNQWDALCANTAASQCGAACDCSRLPPAARACFDASDCGRCSAGAPCEGAWSCDAGVCVPGAPVTCPGDTTECRAPTCNPETGACSSQEIAGACDDGDPCTADSCNTAGACVHTAIPSCGVGDACLPHIEPGASDQAVMACVCAERPECCQQFWDDECVLTAVDQCGVTCDCDELVDGGVPCEEDANCRFCDADLDICNGGWLCVDSLCTEVPVAVYCDASGDAGCLTNQCDPVTGACAVGPAPAACDDEDPCTADHCNAVTGTCQHGVIEDCVAAAACSAQDGPLPYTATTACLCDTDPFCCGVIWDAACASQAATDCGVCQQQ